MPRHRAIDPSLLDEVCAAAAGLAAAVDDNAQAVLCHRDLHPDNLVVNADGELIGIVDWDAAEAWDRAGDWFKLEFELLRAHPDCRDLLLEAYLQGDPIPDQWDRRRQLVHLIETLNILPNAVARAWDVEFADRARSHMLQLLAQVRQQRWPESLPQNANAVSAWDMTPRCRSMTPEPSVPDCRLRR